MEGYSDSAIAVKECYIKQISLTTLTANQVRRNIIAKQWCGFHHTNSVCVLCSSSICWNSMRGNYIKVLLFWEKNNSQNDYF